MVGTPEPGSILLVGAGLAPVGGNSAGPRRYEPNPYDVARVMGVHDPASAVLHF